MQALMEKLAAEHALGAEEYQALLRHWRQVDADGLYARARASREPCYGKDIFVRGLIEISNHCINDCYYCGIRKGNSQLTRYRLQPERILACCQRGHRLGFRSFVLQGGEDPWYSDARLCEIITAIKRSWPDCAVTLSLGEKRHASYAALRYAGADRYLLRHETADADHYARLHPPFLTLAKRIQCLKDLRRLGYQVGAGLMVGSPGQTAGTLAQDLCFLQKLQPHMVGIGPFIPHRNTPFAGHKAGSAEMTLFMLSLVRLMLPASLLPATTALSSISGDGWERGILAGANVIMLNLTPEGEGRHYELYDHKHAAAAEELQTVKARMAAIGYRVCMGRGDYRTPVINE